VASYWATKGIGINESNNGVDIWNFSRSLGGDLLESWIVEHFGENKQSGSAKTETNEKVNFTFKDLLLQSEFVRFFNTEFKAYLQTPDKSRGIILFGERGSGKTEIANHLLNLKIPNLQVIKIGAIERNDLARRMSELTHHSLIVFDDSDLVFESSPRSLVHEAERKDWIALIERFMREVGHYWVFLGSFESTLAGKSKFSREDLHALFGSSGDLLNGVDGHIPPWDAERLMKALGDESRKYTDEALVNLLQTVMEKKMGLRGLLSIHQKLKADCGQKFINLEDVNLYRERYLC
jgi:SpoVK/Ycf46/Vps4 family AAA+-type ATPase